MGNLSDTRELGRAQMQAVARRVRPRRRDQDFPTESDRSHREPIWLVFLNPTHSVISMVRSSL